MTTNRYDILKPEHGARFGEWVERWINIGLSCAPADRGAAEDAYRTCYRLAGLPEPKRVVWVKSPLTLALAGPIAGHIITNIGGHGAVRDAVGDAVHGAVGDAVGDSWYKYLGGRWWSSWLAYESFFDEVCGVHHDKVVEARAYRRAQSAAGWWWPHSDFVIACEPQTRMSRDEMGQLHCEDGSAIQWGDEWALWFIHGVRVTQQVVERPETLTPDQIRAEQNSEVQRVMIERFGPGRYLVACGAKVVDVDTLTLVGSATRALMRDEAGNMWLVGTDGSTGRVYHMSVPRDVETCRQAHEAICGFQESRLIAEA